LVSNLVYCLNIAHGRFYRKDAYGYFVGQSDPHLAKTQPTLADALEFMVLRGSSILESQNRAADLVAFYAELHAETDAPVTNPQPSAKQYGSTQPTFMQPSITQPSPAKQPPPEPCSISSVQSSHPSPLTSPPTKSRTIKAEVSKSKTAKAKSKEAVVVQSDTDNERYYSARASGTYLSVALGEFYVLVLSGLIRIVSQILVQLLRLR
jgi:hypothetical protein